jgi:hypothetical protein
MATGLNCEFIEYRPGRWYYLLEDESSPKTAADWREFSTGYGPFASRLLAGEHMSAYHANPGGSMTLTYAERRSNSEIVEKLIAAAPAVTGSLARMTAAGATRGDSELGL